VIEVKMLPGSAWSPLNEFEFYQSVRTMGADMNKKKKVLVYFIGGVTYGEIAAVRFLNKLFRDKQFIIATTQIVNGESCLDMMRGKLENNLDIYALISKK
jgi:transposase-like protein